MRAFILSFANGLAVYRMLFRRVGPYIEYYSEEGSKAQVRALKGSYFAHM